MHTLCTEASTAQGSSGSLHPPVSAGTTHDTSHTKQGSSCSRWYMSIPGITAYSVGCWSWTEYVRSVVNTHSGQCRNWTSMRPRVIACSRRYSCIPRVNACSVRGWGQTLHSGIQLAGTCWCWSRTPWSLLQSVHLRS